MNLSAYKMAQQDAEECLYAPITRHFTIDEHWMLRNVIRDMLRGGIEFVLVPVTRSKMDGLEVWRLKEELKLDEEQYESTTGSLT